MTALDVLCAHLMRDLFAIAKFLFTTVLVTMGNFTPPICFSLILPHLKNLDGAT